MPQHEIEIEIPAKAVLHKDVTFTIKSDGAKLGQLRISKGSIDWQPGKSGVPLLTDALACLECEIAAEHPTGDHWIIVGRVQNLLISPIKDPLVFFAGAFQAVQQGE